MLRWLAQAPWFACRTHDSHVTQLSELNRRRRNKLEKMLALFQQMNLQSNKYLKEFTDEMPGEFKEVLERLRQAAMDRQILEQMEIEGEVLTAWKQRERVHEKTLDEAKARGEDDGIVRGRNGFINFVPSRCRLARLGKSE